MSVKVGETLFKGQPKAKTGKQYYQSTEFHQAISRDDYKRPHDSFVRLNVFPGKIGLEDIKTIDMLESKVCKSQFRICLCLDDDKVLKMTRECLNDYGYKNVKFVRTPKALQTYTKDNAFNLVLSQYDFFDDEDGLNVYNDYAGKENKDNELMNVCLVSGYSPVQFMHIARTGVDILRCLVQEESKEIFQKAIQTVTDLYYFMYLVEMVYGKEKAQEFRQRETRMNHTTGDLEAMLNKCKFKIFLACSDELRTKMNVKTLNELGFTNIVTESCPKKAGTKLSQENYDLILSDYRFKREDKDGKSVYDQAKDKLNFVLTFGVEECEIKNLKIKKINVLDNATHLSVEYWEEVRQTVLGYYIEFVRKKLAELL